MKKAIIPSLTFVSVLGWFAGYGDIIPQALAQAPDPINKKGLETMVKDLSEGREINQ